MEGRRGVTTTYGVIRYKTLADLLMSVDQLSSVNKLEGEAEGKPVYMYYCYVSSDGIIGVKYAMDRRNYSGWIGFKEGKLVEYKRPSTTAVRVCEVEFDSILETLWQKASVEKRTEVEGKNGA